MKEHWRICGHLALLAMCLMLFGVGGSCNDPLPDDDGDGLWDGTGDPNEAEEPNEPDNGWVVWEAQNILGQLFVDPESILTEEECTYSYACGGNPPDCTVVSKVLVFGPYATEAEAWEDLCSRITDRGSYSIWSPCPYWVEIDGVVHTVSWNPWLACP